jgi:hypothetical protein
VCIHPLAAIFVDEGVHGGLVGGGVVGGLQVGLAALGQAPAPPLLLARQTVRREAALAKVGWIWYEGNFAIFFPQFSLVRR